MDCCERTFYHGSRLIHAAIHGVIYESINPSDLSQESGASVGQTLSGIQTLIGVLIAIFGPIPLTALIILVIAINSDCNTFQCCKAHTLIGAVVVAIGIPHISLIAALTPQRLRIASPLIGLAIWVIVVGIAYSQIM